MCDEKLTLDFQYCHEGFLGDFDGANAFHPFFPFFLFFQQFSFAGDITSVTFGRDILAHGSKRFSGNDLGTDCRLDRNLLHLLGDQLFDFFC